MERFNFNKPVHVEIIYEDDDEGDTTEEIDVVNLSDHEQTLNSSSMEDSHETEASNTFRIPLNNNEDDRLQIVSQNMSSIVDAYLNYSYQYHKVNSKEANHLKSIYLKTKIYLFQQSFPMSLLLLRPEHRKEQFVQNFLKQVINKTRVKPNNITSDILRLIYNDLIQWTEIKMGRKTFVPQERYKSHERLLFESPHDLNNNNQSYNEQRLKDNDDSELTTHNEETLNAGISFSFNSIRNLISQTDIQNPSRSTNVNSQINHASSNNNLHNGPVVIENNNSSSVLTELIDLTNNNQENIHINNNNIQNINNNKIAGKTKSDIYLQKSQNSVPKDSQSVENLSPEETVTVACF